MELEVRRYGAGDEAQILGLFHRVFGREMTLQFWRWRFRDNPAGAAEIALAWDGDTLAGHYAAIPMLLEMDGSTVRALLSMTTMTHPDYGGRGIFTTLAGLLYEEADAAGYAAVYGFPNVNSRHGFVSKLGWTDVGPMRVLRSDGPVPPAAGSGLALSDELPADTDDLWPRMPRAGRVAVARTQAFIAWRYASHPEAPYRYATARDAGGRLAGLAVLKTYRGTEETVGHMIDLMVGNPDVADRLIEFAVGTFAGAVDRVECWFPAGSQAERGLLACGFERHEVETAFGYRPFRAMPIREPLGMGDWWLTMGDSDVF